MSINKNTYYQHRYGGIYEVNYSRVLSTVDKSEWVLYTHVWPFELSAWIRPKAEWEDGRFKEINGKELMDIFMKDRKSFQDEINANKLAAKKEEGK